MCKNYNLLLSHTFMLRGIAQIERMKHNQFPYKQPIPQGF